ncbi:MAG TPA: NAD(P)H-binding protein [Pseudonocardia sp.]
MTVLVTGARGTVGGGVLDGLRAAGVSVRAGARDPSRLSLPAGVDAVAVDLDSPATFPAALDGVEAVFCYAGRDLGPFAAAARDAGVEHVVLLSSGAVVEADPETDPIAGLHARAERALRDAGLATTALRAGAFCGNTLQWARSIGAAGVVELPYPDARVASIHERDIADVAVAALTTGRGRGEAPSLTGPRSLSFAEHVAVLGDVLGRPVAVRAVDPDDARAAMARYAPPDVVDSLFTLWAAADGVPATVTEEVERLTGHPARTYDQWAHEHRDAFAGAADGS